MPRPFNRLTPAQVERLALLAEELSEATQMVGKILRHGLECYNPNDPLRVSNKRLLQRELGDVLAAMSLLREAGDINTAAIENARLQKLGRVGKYLHHNARIIKKLTKDLGQ